MTRQDSIHDHAATRPLAAGALFARKGEAVPVGGRAAPRRVITMRPLSCEPHALPQPANTSLPAPSSPGGANSPENVVPIVPTMGPVTAAAAIHAARPAGTTRARPARASLTIRAPVRPVPVRKRAAAKRTTLRLDDALRARLERFGASETLSVQLLLTRALERFLPAISIERAGTSSLPLPGNAPVAPRASATSRRSVRFDPHLHWRLKTAAAKRKRSMQSIMVAALATYLGGLERGGRTARAEVIAPASGPAARPMLAIV